MIKRPAILALITLVAIAIAGCAGQPVAPDAQAKKTPRGGGYYENDGPPDNEDIDIASIADAVPKNEPLSDYGNPDSYEALGKTYYVLKSAAGFTQTGRASWYGRQFHGERTSSGEPYSMYKMTAAHKRLPIPSYVRVTNLDNGRQVIVRVNDRGPFHTGRIIDLSYVAARRLGIVADGSAPVRIATVTPADMQDEASDARTAKAATPKRSDRTPHVGRTGGHTIAANNASRKTASTVEPNPSPRHLPPHAHAIAVADRRDAARTASGLFLQTGAFGEPGNARRQQSRLNRSGFENVSIIDPEATTPFYRVQVGPFASDRRRALAREILIDRGFAVRDVAR